MRTVLAAAIVIAGLGATAALAHGVEGPFGRYWIEETYDPTGTYSKSRMVYAPGFNPISDKCGYWYGIPGYSRDTCRSHRRVSYSRHVRWCRAHYRSYDAYSDTFIGKGYKAYRCVDPYNG